MPGFLSRLFGKAEPSRATSPRPPAARPGAPGARLAPPPAANTRRSERVVARIPVILKREGRAITAVTGVVNDEGGLVISPEDLPLGYECPMQHFDTKKTAKVRVVWNGGLDELGSYKLGVEFVDEAPGFWGAAVQAGGGPPAKR